MSSARAEALTPMGWSGGGTDGGPSGLEEVEGGAL